MKTRIKLVVLDEFILGIIHPEFPDKVCILHESVLKGGCRSSTTLRYTMPIYKSSKVRLASEQDFNDYNVHFGGFGNEGVYEFER